MTDSRSHGTGSRSILCTALLLPVAVTAIPAWSASPEQLFAPYPVLERHELAERRGGFEFAGLSFEFGANIRSYFDHKLVLESLISISDDGINQEVINVVSQPHTPGDDALSAVQVQMPTGAVDVSGAVTGQPAQSGAGAAQTPAIVDLVGLSNAVGVSLNDHKGYTAALHQATRERITSMIINTASRRDIRQELEVRVDVANFRQFQQAARQAVLNTRLGAASQR